jgi:HEAT repeats
MAIFALSSAPARLSRARRRRWFAGVVIVLAAGLVGFVVSMRLPSEPVYRGKALSDWLRVYSSPLQPSSREWQEADEAVSALGTNCLPTLLRMFQARDSRFKLQIVALLKKQKLIRTHPVTAAERNYEAAMAFLHLGEFGKPAVADLVTMLYQPLSTDSKGAIEDALARIGPAAQPAIPVLLRNAGDPNSRIRANALWALGQIHAQPELCVPQLMRGLSDTDGWAQVSACHALGMFGVEAQAAIPNLRALAEPPKKPVRLRFFTWPDGMTVGVEARNALRKIEPQALSSENETNVPADFGVPEAR